MDQSPLRTKFDPELLTPSDRYGWFAVARNALPFFGLLALAPNLAKHAGWPAWLLGPFIGLFVYRLTLVMHDCAHGTLFQSARTNQWMGSLLGALTGIDFRKFAVLHWKHHRIYGQRGDPQGFHYIGVHEMSRLRFAWHVFKPLTGANLRHALPESLLNPRNLRRKLRTGEVVVITAVQLLVITIVSGGGSSPLLAILPFVSAATVGLFISQLRGLAEHGVRGNAVQRALVRSHAPRCVEQILLYDLNFNYHATHHAWPQYPSCRLPSLHQRHSSTQLPLDGSMLGTVVAIGVELHS